MMIKKLSLITAVVAILTFVSVPKASADSFSLNVINCNCLPSGSSDGGSVQLTLQGNGEVQVVVTLDSGLDFHDTNSFDDFAFDNSGGAVTLDTTGAGATAGLTLSTTPTGTASMDGAGKSFQEFVDFPCPGPCTGNNTGVTTITFYLQGSGLSTSQFENIHPGATHPNSADFAAAVSNASISGCTGVISGGNGTSASTAVASTSSSCGSGTSTPTTTPEPSSSYLLLLAGLVLALAYKPLKTTLSA